MIKKKIYTHTYHSHIASREASNCQAMASAQGLPCGYRADFLHLTPWVEMTPSTHRRRYILICAIVLLLWIWFGVFEAIEAPYVGF